MPYGSGAVKGSSVSYRPCGIELILFLPELDGVRCSLKEYASEEYQ